MLQVEHGRRSSGAEFFEDGGKHHGAEAEGIAGDDDECELPCEAAARESVVEAGMRDGWRILAADCVIEEVERRDYQNSPDCGDPENDLGEFHEGLVGIGLRKNEL